MAKRQLQYPWYLEPNAIANAAIAQLLPEEQVCDGILDQVGREHQAWGCDDLHIIEEVLKRNEHFRGASITVWQRTREGMAIRRMGIIHIP